MRKEAKIGQLREMQLDRFSFSARQHWRWRGSSYSGFHLSWRIISRHPPFALANARRAAAIAAAAAAATAASSLPRRRPARRHLQVQALAAAARPTHITSDHVANVFRRSRKGLTEESTNERSSIGPNHCIGSRRLPAAAVAARCGPF
jgi:chorismate mutase